MARIFITGSADGLGQLAAKALVAEGHRVVLHARNEQRGREAMDKVSGADGVLTADLSSTDATKELAAEVNALGTFDAVIHNAAVYQDSGEQIFAVNTLAPYVLTCLIQKPKRLIYMSSGMHMQGHFESENFKGNTGAVSYSDSKLHVLMLCFAVARRWPEIYANALDPGWVPTKMGGSGAPDDLQEGYETQVWLAAGDDEKAKVSGRYFHHRKESRYNPEANDAASQDKFLNLCEEITGVSFP
ncbi:MAG TPA: SDR family NAD(P)-dependent oxidoreductase [Pyrinomonadaceae bacterium]|nr:SDR family NAD(P)-dependent oxidoreductase [Pyrinomonadaceae bacterium]